MRTRIGNLALSLVIAAVAAVGVGYWTKTSRENAVAEYAAEEREGPSAPRDRVQAAIDEVRADGVHVAPDGRGMLSRKDEAELEKVLASSSVEVRAIFWRETSGAGAYLDTDRQLEEAFADERSVLIVWEGPERGQVIQTGADDYVPFDQSDFLGDPVETISGALAEIEQGTTWESEDHGSDYWGGIGGGIAAGLLFGFLALLGLGLLVLVLRGVSGGALRLPGRW